MKEVGKIYNLVYHRICGVLKKVCNLVSSGADVAKSLRELVNGKKKEC